MTLGLVSALATRVRSDGGRYALVKAGWIAGGAWVAGMGFAVRVRRLGQPRRRPALARFSAEHHITSGDAWTAALVLMALGEVLVRTLVLVARRARGRSSSAASWSRA